MDSPVEARHPSTYDVREEKLRIGVLAFDNLSGDPELDWLCTSLPEVVATGLSLCSNLSVLAPRAVAKVLPPLPRQARTESEIGDIFALKAGLTNVVTGSFSRTNGSGSIQVRVCLRDSLARKPLRAFTAFVDRNRSVLTALNRVVRQISTSLNCTLPKQSGSLRSPAIHTTPDRELEQIRQYRILEELGKGGVGKVFLADDTSLRRKVAIKLLRNRHRDPRSKIRFLHEARLAAAIDHPYICSIYEVGTTGCGRPFIAMEYIGGLPLRNRVKKGALSVAETLRISLEVAEALEAAHSKGIVHRDLKPENIMFTEQGHAKVLDFGLAESLEESPTRFHEDPTATTKNSIPAGTLAYMAPEQIRGEPLDSRSDIFSLGIVIHEMLKGDHPFRKRTFAETAACILHDSPQRLTHHSAQIPQLLALTVEKMLDKHPSRRFQSMREVRNNLKLLADKQPLLRKMSVAIRSTIAGIALLAAIGPS
jgi:serine/threonine protein kinase/TolB-like protein